MSSQSPGRGRSALHRVLVRSMVLGLAATALCTAPGQPMIRDSPTPDRTLVATGASGGQAGRPPRLLRAVPVPGQPAAAPHRPHLNLPEVVGGKPIPLPGSIYRNPISGRNEVVVPNVSRTAVLIGDSQSAPANGWPRQALAALGYQVHFAGLGGTGYVKANGGVGNYIDALEHGHWLLPVGMPALVVVEGGGNDAGSGATDAQITVNANRLLHALKSRYPATQIVVIGTLGRGAANGGGRRTQVDALLGGIAARHGLPFVSVGDWLTRYKLTHRLTDGVHMNAEGHDALGVLLEQRLRELKIRDLKSAAGSVSIRPEDRTTVG